MRIRRFREEDAEEVSRLICKAVKKVLIKDYPQDVIQYVLQKHTPERILAKSKKWDIYVVVENDRILGTGNLRRDRLYNLFVDPRFHGKGAGKKLVSFLEKKARKEGQKTLSLSSSISAQGFYEKLGYRRIRIIRRKVGGDGILMKKDL